jgi:hypothetical protein
VEQGRLQDGSVIQVCVVRQPPSGCSAQGLSNLPRASSPPPLSHSRGVVPCQVTAVECIVTAAGRKVCCILATTPLADVSDDELQTRDALPFASSDMESSAARPQLGERQFYLPLWADDCMSTVPGWESLREPMHYLPRGFVVPTDVPTIADIVRTAPLQQRRSQFVAEARDADGVLRPSKNKVHKRAPLPRGPGDDVRESEWAGFGPEPADTRKFVEVEEDVKPLVGRLACVGKLVHFGTPQRSHPCPFRFTFRLGTVQARRPLSLMMIVGVVLRRRLCLFYSRVALGCDARRSRASVVSPCCRVRTPPWLLFSPPIVFSCVVLFVGLTSSCCSPC